MSAGIESYQNSEGAPMTEVSQGEHTAIAIQPNPMRTNSGGRVASLRTLSVGGRPVQATLARQVSNNRFLRGNLQPQFYCQICMNQHPISEAETLSGCGHAFCKTCTHAYIAGKVRESQLFIRCMYDLTLDVNGDPITTDTVVNFNQASTAPVLQTTAGDQTAAGIAPTPVVGGTCGAQVSEDDILRILASDPADVERYNRFKATANDPNTRNCPYSGCGHSQVGVPSRPIMSCERCGREYCFTHANAHVGKTCATYEREMLQDTKLNEAAINKDSKRCPKCKIPIQKSSGCNHMKCPKCSQDFCWICGRGIEGGVLPAHYAWWNLTGCPNRQMTENPTAPDCCYRLGTILAFIFLGPPALILTLLAFILCPCICIPIMLSNDEGSCAYFSMMLTMSMMLVGMVLLAILSMPLVVVAFGLVVVCCPCFVWLLVKHGK